MGDFELQIYCGDGNWEAAQVPEESSFNDVTSCCVAAARLEESSSHNTRLRGHAALRDSKHLQGYMLVASSGTILSSDEHLQQFRDVCKTSSCPCTLYWQPRNAVNRNIQAVCEDVSFIPHPKTMTMAGEWEYFAAGSQHPFPFAIAELIDNSLRATRGNKESRRIVVSLVLDSTSAGHQKSGVVSVWDNGCGMSKRQLNDWAVMNLTMEDRGQQPKEVATARHGQGSAAAKQLHSDLSYFGVGSKNAAFFMGRCIKVTTKSPDHVLVHEMEISADSLEQRYQVSPEQVYKETINKRMPGDATSAVGLPSIEQQWIQVEAAEAGSSEAGGSESFTRVTVSTLKPEILHQFTVEEGGHVCKQLAHMYHYYLHGAQGRRGAGGEENVQQNGADNDVSRLPTGDLVPQITVQLCSDSGVVWATDLLDVTDDLESQYLSSKASTFPFTLEVRGKGAVEGVLWYFPFREGRETVPQAVNQFIKQAQKEGGIGTQLTQALTQATQHAAVQDEVIEIDSADEAEELHAAHPIFEVFWQGRLIPGTSVASIPFVDELRVKMHTAAWKEDGVPDECFKRLRGALFVGPSWSVTRNKLKLRDNLDTLLANAMATDRTLDKSFRKWLGDCHRDLDKTCLYQELLCEADMTSLRSQFGRNTTFFKRVTDDSRTIEQGSLVLCEKQNFTVAEVHCVGVSSLHQASTQAAGGFAIVSPMPAVMWSSDSVFKVSLRRISLPSPELLTAALQKEHLKLPSSLEVQRKDPGKLVKLDAGRKLTEFTLEAVNEDGKKLTSRTITVRGKKVPLTLCRMVLQFDSPDAAWPVDPAALFPAAQAAAKSGSGSGKRGKAKKGKAGTGSSIPATTQPQSATVDDLNLEGATKVFVEEIGATRGASFELKAIQEPFKNSGHYGVLCMLQPVIDRERPVVHMMEVHVSAGQPQSLEVSGPGADMVQSCMLHLGQHVGALDLQLKDELGNVNHQVIADADVRLSLVHAMAPGEAREDDESPDDLVLQYDVCKQEGGELQVCGLHVEGKADMATEEGLPSFAAYSSGFLKGCTMSQIPALHAVALPVALRIKVNTLTTDVSMKLLPGVPVRPVLTDEGPFLTGPSWKDCIPYDQALEGGAPLPAFSVQACDVFGNVCIPSPALTWSITTKCIGICPNPAVAAPDMSGVATLLNAQVAKNVAKDEDWTVGASVHVAARATEAAEGMEAIMQAGTQTVQLEELRLLLAPSTGPHSLSMCVGDHDIPFQDNPETGKREFNLGELAAGSFVEEISFTTADEGGRPVPAGVTGKMMCGWMKKARTANFTEEGALVVLPKLPVPSEVGPRQYDLRFWNHAEGFDIEAVLVVSVLPAAPALWQIWPIEGEGSCIEVKEDDQGWGVVCGQPFSVALELVDKFGNKCPKHEVEPTVSVRDAVEGSACRLAAPGSSLEAAWQVLQDDESDSAAHFFSCAMVLCGEQGEVEIVVPPVAIEGDEPLQLPELQQSLTILPGPPVKLKMSVQSAVQYGAKGNLGEIAVHSVDCSGNASAPDKDFEVTLKPSASSPDDPSKSAKVAAKGSNRARMLQGQAVFKDVHLKSDSQGLFQLAVYCKSRAVVMEEACTTVELRPCNAVTAVAVDAGSLPLAPVPAGSDVSIKVDVSTEDKSPVPLADIVQGLTLQLMAPGAKSKAAQVVRVDEDGSEATVAEGKLSFSTGALTTAGQHSLIAEWREHRMGLPHVHARSPAATITVAPGPPADAQVSLCNDSITLLASNGASASMRLALKQLHVQLLDVHGNFTSPGCRSDCRVALQWQEGIEPSWGGCELPQLVTSADSEPQKALDMSGAVCFGDILVSERSGRIIPDPEAGAGAPAAVNLCIKVQLQGVQFEGEPMEVDGEGWSTIWEKELLFSDDANHIAKVVELSQAQRKHAAEAQEVAGRSAELRVAVQGAQDELDGAQQHLKHIAAATLPHTPALSMDDLCNAEALRGRLAELAAAKALAGDSSGTQISGAESVGRKARYGHPQQAQTAAVKHLLDAQPEGLLGPLAELGSVQDTRLSELLSAHLSTSLRTLVVATTESRVAMSGMLRAAQKEVPDILALNVSNRCTSQQPKLRTDLGSLPQSVRKLIIAASQTSEAPLAVPLPHASFISNLERQRKPVPDMPFGKLDWPAGCIDYAVNLIRPSALPSIQNLRATVFWTLLSRTLVFETLQQAEEYREALMRAGGTCPDIISLDGGRLRGNGVVTGSSFAVQSISHAPFRFSQLPAAQNPMNLAHEQEEASLQKALQAAEDVERCMEALRAAEHAASHHAAQNAGDVDRLHREVGELDKQMKKGTKRSMAACAITASQPRRKRAAAARALDAAGLEDDDA